MPDATGAWLQFEVKVVQALPELLFLWLFFQQTQQ